MRILSGLFLICFLTISILAQQGAAITAQLTENGKAVSNTQVKLVSQSNKETELRTTTDKDGNYRFENVSNGNYWIVYSDFNGNERSQTVHIENGNVSFIDSPIREEVNVKIASGISQPIDEVSKTVNVIDAQEIRDRSEFSLTDTLKTIPGFRVQQLGGFGKTANIKTRGLRNQDTAVLLDGVRFRDASSITGDASAFLSDFVLTDTNRVEVLRGSGSSLYGTNAIGGVLDLRTNEPRNGFHGSLLGEGGSLGLKRFRGNVSDGIDKFGFSLGVSRTIFSEGIDKDDDAHNTNAQGRIDYRPFSKTSISGRVYISDAYVKLNSSPDTIGTLPASNATIIRAVPLSRSELNRYADGIPILQLNRGNANFISDTNDPDNFQKSQFFNGQLVLNQIINDRLNFSATYQGLKTSRKNTNGISGIGFQPFGGAQTSVFDGQIHTLNTHFNWTPNSHNLITAGYEYEWEKFGNDGIAPGAAGNFSTRAKQKSNTFYVQDLLNFFNNRLQIAGGFRAQFFNLKNPTFSAANPPYRNLTLENPPNAYTFDGSASYFFQRSGTKIRVHVGNGYRVPSLYERFGTFYSSFSQNFIALGDPNLKPERSIAFDGGVDQTLFKNRAKLTATYFYTRLIDTIGFGNVVANIGTTTRPFGGYITTKGGIARGAEFSGRVKATNSTDVFTSYTFTNSDQRTPQVSGSRILQTLGVPTHQFTLVATQRFKRLTVNFDFLATSDYLAPIFSNATFGTYIYRFDGSRKADLTGSYEIPFKSEKLRFRLFGTIENLFDYDYYENGFRTAGRTGRAGLSLSF
ncbi:MAG: TonB-dependent receptor [Pyrinomonadaceae bacterium]